MKKYARICEGEVQELFATDGDITQMFHPDLIWVDVTDLDPAPVVGWIASWIATDESGVWSLSAPVELPKTESELKAEAVAMRDVLLAAANEATAGMADAFIADLLDEADVAKFKAFAKYKLALNKIDQQPGYPETITWPTLPQ